MMKMRYSARAAMAAAAVLTAGLLSLASAQDQGAALVDLNTAAEAELAKLPHVTPAIAKDLVATRPFKSITEANAFFLGHKLTQAQATEIYGKAFVRVGLNKGTEQEFLLIPGVGSRMAHEFEEYRPWKNKAQFDKEIGKYVDKAEVERLWRYVVID